jgi:hypothetical protein
LLEYSLYHEFENENVCEVRKNGVDPAPAWEGNSNIGTISHVSEEGGIERAMKS